jgi:hypothetical protein
VTPDGLTLTLKETPDASLATKSVNFTYLHTVTSANGWVKDNNYESDTKHVVASVSGKTITFATAPTLKFNATSVIVANSGYNTNTDTITTDTAHNLTVGSKVKYTQKAGEASSNALKLGGSAFPATGAYVQSVTGNNQFTLELTPGGSKVQITGGVAGDTFLEVSRFIPTDTRLILQAEELILNGQVRIMGDKHESMSEQSQLTINGILQVGDGDESDSLKVNGGMATFDLKDNNTVDPNGNNNGKFYVKTTGNYADVIKLHAAADASGHTDQTIKLQNDAGTGSDAIALESQAGGISLYAIDDITLHTPFGLGGINLSVGDNDSTHGSDILLRSGDTSSHSSNGGMITLITGASTSATGGDGGKLELKTSKGNSRSGQIELSTANNEAGKQMASGPIDIKTGNAEGMPAGDINIKTGEVTSSSILGGNINIKTGNCTNGVAAGGINLQVGDTDSTAGSDIVLHSGKTTAVNSAGGKISLMTGAGNVSSGNIELLTANSSVDGKAGHIYLTVGDSLGETDVYDNGGNILLSAGNAKLDGGNISLTTGESSTQKGGQLNLTTSIGSNGSGDIELSTARSTVSMNTMVGGKIDIKTGDVSGGAVGGINLTAGTSDTSNGADIVLTAGNTTGTENYVDGDAGYGLGGNIILSAGVGARSLEKGGGVGKPDGEIKLKAKNTVLETVGISKHPYTEADDTGRIQIIGSLGPNETATPAANSNDTNLNKDLWTVEVRKDSLILWNNDKKVTTFKPRV